MSFIVILGAVTALAAAGIDMYLPSLPAIEAELGEGLNRAQYTLSAFFFGLAIGQLFYGPISDSFGRKRILLAGIILYCCGSGACFLSQSMFELLIARFLQAFGGAAGLVIVRAMVRDLYSRDEAARAQSFIYLVFLITPLLAPNIGGYLLVLLGWRAIFIILCFLGILSCLALFFKVPETLVAKRRTPLSFYTLFTGYKRILSEPQSLGCILSGVFAFSCMFTYFAASPFVYITLFQVPEEYYGLLFGLNVIGIMIANVFNVRLVTSLGAIYMLRVGLVVAAIGGVSLSIISYLGIWGIFGIIIPLFIVVGSLGFIGANAVAGVLEPFPELAGTASSLFGFLQMTMGAAMGGVVAIFHDGTALPMGILIGVLSILGLISGLLLLKPRDIV